MLVSRAFLQATGPMREDYFLYCEEVEWCLRARAKGMAFGFAPEARVLHNQGASTGSGQSVRTRPRLPIYLDERNKMLVRSEEHTSELQSLMRISYAVFCLKKKTHKFINSYNT